MKRSTALVTTLAWLVFTGAGAQARPNDAKPAPDAPINTVCPISKETVGKDSPTFVYKDKTIALCCKDCKEDWDKLTETQKDERVVTLVAMRQPAKPDAKAGDQPAGDKMVGDPYPLETCPVSGHKLDNEAVIKVYQGREIRFCCKDCPADFEKDPAKYLAKVDAEIVKSQTAYYPLTTCVVSGEALDDKAVNYVYNNRLIRFCCKDCPKDFLADPAKFTAKIDAAIIAKQKADYPMDTCLVSGKKLGSMGDPIDKVVAGRLVRYCCGGCPGKVMKSPAEYLAKLDAAWAAKKGTAPKEAPKGG